MFLLKQVQTIVAGRQNDAQTIKIPRSYTTGKAYDDLVLQATPLGAKRLLCVASAFFFGKCDSIIVVDLFK